MSKFLKAAAVCSAALFICISNSGAAWDFGLLRAKAPASTTEVKDPAGAKDTAANAQSVKAANIGYTDFDGFNNIADPLYREGSKSLLRKAMEEEKAKVPGKTAPARVSHPVMRDAPAGISAKDAQTPPVRNTGEEKVTAPPFKKNRLIKMIPADPLKSQSTL